MIKQYPFLYTLFNKIMLNIGNFNEIPLGLVVVIIIESPVVVLVLSSLLGRPRSRKVFALFLGWLISMVVVFIGSFYSLSFILSLFY